MNRHIHLIGIGGTGLSAIARLLLESGYNVSGSDQAMNPIAESLVAVGAKVYIGHRAENITGADTIVRSSAVPDNNPEVVAGLALKIPVLKRSEFLGQLLSGHTVIAIAGTHGKTTTTGMIAWMLTCLGEDPSYIVGSTVNQLGVNAHAGKGRLFIIEADEYDRMFLGLRPDISVITFLELDHPDCYPTFAEYRAAFMEFARSTRSDGTVLVCGDSENPRNLAQDLAGSGSQVLTYGIEPGNSLCAVNIKLEPDGRYNYDLAMKTGNATEILVRSIRLEVPGRHNILNSIASLGVARQLGLNLEKAAAALSSFTGTGRRLEVVGEVNGITLIDDYAHHPTEISTTLAALRARYMKRRIIAVWQPHTYSRTNMFLNEFTHAFADADLAIVTEIYASREHTGQFSAGSLVAQMDPAHTRFIPEIQVVTDTLRTELQPGDVLVVLSAGDANIITSTLADELKGRQQ